MTTAEERCCRHCSERLQHFEVPPETGCQTCNDHRSRDCRAGQRPLQSGHSYGQSWLGVKHCVSGLTLGVERNVIRLPLLLTTYKVVLMWGFHVNIGNPHIHTCTHPASKKLWLGKTAPSLLSSTPDGDKNDQIFKDIFIAVRNVPDLASREYNKMWKHCSTHVSREYYLHSFIHYLF